MLMVSLDDVDYIDEVGANDSYPLPPAWILDGTGIGTAFMAVGILTFYLRWAVGLIRWDALTSVKRDCWILESIF
jgi:hypothetical protein